MHLPLRQAPGRGSKENSDQIRRAVGGGKEVLNPMRDQNPKRHVPGGTGGRGMNEPSDGNSTHQTTSRSLLMVDIIRIGMKKITENARRKAVL